MFRLCQSVALITLATHILILMHTMTEPKLMIRAQELCESQGGHPGFLSQISLRFLWT